MLQAYHVGFSATLNHLMEIGAVVALVGAVCGFALVRQRDFVVPTGAPSGPSLPRGPGSAGPDRRRRPGRACVNPFTLEGTFVRLEPLTEAHIPALVEAAGRDRSTYQWTYTPEGLEQMTDYVVDALAKVASGAHVAFATVRRGAGPDGSDLVVGATRFCEMASGNGRPARATSDTACPTWSTSASPGWPGRPSGPRSTPRPSS